MNLYDIPANYGYTFSIIDPLLVAFLVNFPILPDLNAIRNVTTNPMIFFSKKQNCKANLLLTLSLTLYMVANNPRRSSHSLSMDLNYLLIDN